MRQYQLQLQFQRYFLSLFQGFSWTWLGLLGMFRRLSKLLTTWTTSCCSGRHLASSKWSSTATLTMLWTVPGPTALLVLNFACWMWLHLVAGHGQKASTTFQHGTLSGTEWYCVSLCVIDAVFILLWSLLHVMLFVNVLMCFYLSCFARYEFCGVRSKRLEEPPVVWEPQLGTCRLNWLHNRLALSCAIFSPISSQFHL